MHKRLVSTLWVRWGSAGVEVSEVALIRSHYLLGNQSLDQLERFRGLGGAQSYPSRTKDAIPVDFSTG